MKIFTTLILLRILLIVKPQCKFNNEKQEILFEQLKILADKKFVSDDKNEEFKYEFKLCSCPNEAFKDKDASVIQYHKVKSNWEFSKVIGSHNKIDLNAGKNWFHLIYHDGDEYQDICSTTKRNAQIYIICDITRNSTEFKFLYEYKDTIDIPLPTGKSTDESHVNGSKNVINTKLLNQNSNGISSSVPLITTTKPTTIVKIPNCGYVFELRLWDDALCKVLPNWDPSSYAHHSLLRTKGGKSAGTVLCILFFTFFGGYIIGGVCYRKYKLGIENGVALIPNLDMWRTFLELQRDGCVYFYNNNPIVKSAGALGSSRNDYASFSNPTALGGVPNQTLDASSYSYGLPPSAASYTSPAGFTGNPYGPPGANLGSTSSGITGDYHSYNAKNLDDSLLK